MHRRDFIVMATGAMAFGALAACSSGVVRDLPSSVALPLDAAAYRIQRRMVKTRFGNIACIDRGNGAAALFLHGFPLNSFQWRGAIDRLSPYRRCIAPDLLGLGYTEVAPGQSVAPDAQVDMLAELLDALGIATVDLVANDSGGAAAQMFVVRYPDRVRTLLLTNCDAEPDCPPPALLPVLELARKGEFVSQWLAPWLADKTLARSAQGLGGMTFTHPHNPSDEAIDYYLSPLVAAPERTHAYALALERNWLAGFESKLRRCRAPTRIVWGTGDTIFSAGSPDYLDRCFGNSRGVRRVGGAKLFFPEEFPDLIAEEARRLWSV
ncbi:alpha/beta fold hydrolase [Lysobacter niabensis]|uniref:alpha/beta fold hydrolase n=1 Tax=Agrilutibacter niabensis TaxID=380628 RepID=UPI0036142333